MLNGEPKVGFRPVRLELSREGEKVSEESRVNYSKLVTVEHCVEVFFIGTIVSEDWEIVADATNACWERKVYQKMKRLNERINMK